MIIFDNCLIQAPDGMNLSRCSRKKLNWYLGQGLADLVHDEPPTIRLRFEPSGRKGVHDPLLMEGKPNLCVVCGSTGDDPERGPLTRHHIIPYSFVRHMDVECKMDIVRDIFPLCRRCHNDYETESMLKRQAMAREAGMSLAGLSPEQCRLTRKACASAHALLRYGDRIPEPRRVSLLRDVQEFLGREAVAEEDLRYVRDYKLADSDDYVNFSKFVASRVTDYSLFAKEWREHFVATMRPKHMPPQWRVDRKTENVWVPRRVLAQARQKVSPK